MPVRLVALDLDGTLLDSRGRLREANRRAIARVRERGAQVAICTGRRHRDARPVALELGLDVPVISHNGALTRRASTDAAGEPRVSAHLLAVETAREVVTLTRALGADPFVCLDPGGDGVLAYDAASARSPALTSYLRWSRRVVGDEPRVRVLADLARQLEEPPLHIFFSGRCREMAELADLIAARLGARVRVQVTSYASSDFALTDVLDPRASKGAGLAAAAAELGVAREEVMAIGDNENDLTMLDWAGTPVLMANAPAELRARGRYHMTATNDEDGVALALERFVLCGEEAA